jgi:glycerol-3-phosphate O-acyltransferase
VLAKKSLSKQQILLLIAELSSFPPLLKRELFIYVSTEQAAFYTESLLTNMLAMGLIETNESEIQTPAADSQEFYSAWLLNRSIQETFHPYAVVLTLLSKQKRVRPSVLEKTSAQFAERLATLHGLKPLEFFDKKGLSTLIQA